MRAQHPQFLRKRFVVSHHHPAVAARAEVFGGIKAETAKSSKGADRFAAVSRADGLRAIFDHLNAPLLRQRQQLLHRRRLTKQMHRNDRFRAPGDSARHLFGIEVERARGDVGKYNPRPHLVNGFRRRNVSERRGDDFVARPNPQRAQGECQRVRTGIDADAELGPCERRDLLLQRRDVWSENEAPISEHFFDSAQQLVLEGGVLRPWIQKGNVHDH